MSGGMSKQRLGRLHDVLSRHVERGRAPGVVTLLARKGEVFLDTIGTKSLGGTGEMRRDTIFRISSMTKPVIAAATMILVEECVLRLDDPVDELLPELADRSVLRRPDAPITDTVSARRPITLRDLLTFRCGLGLLFSPHREFPVNQAIRELGVLGFGAPDPAAPNSPDEWLKRIATLPLICQPGERWLYNTGSEILGVLLSRASGLPLEDFLRQRIFEPLGMWDTGFSVPAEKLDRLADAYRVEADGGELVLSDGAADSRWKSPPMFPSGGGGLVSTVDDYFAFGRMMLNKGRNGSDRLLSRLSVEVMTTDQLTPEQKAAGGLGPGYWDHRGWGFGVGITTGRDDVSAVPGRFGWDGGLGTSWYSDPAEDLVGILMTQRMEFPLSSPVYRDFWTSAYHAIDD
jgi:CubicO group peptidase (beta-lactamase class C family)